MKTIKLRPYQDKAVEQCREAIRHGKSKMILCSPTGSGKTFIFSYMAMLAIQKGKKVLIVTDRIELMKQTGGSLQALGVDALEIKAGHHPDLSGQLYTAMVETLARRMKKKAYQTLLSNFDLIVFDEAHKQTFNKLFEYITEGTVVIGATATPHRKSSQTSLEEFYDTLIDVIQIPELIEQGFLSVPVSYGVPADLSEVKKSRGDYDVNQMGTAFTKNRVFDGVVANYKRLAAGKKALAFSPNIESSQRLTEELQQAGINAKHLDSTMASGERKMILKWLEETPNAVLSNVGILTTGFDCPTIEVIILYRATTSLPLFLQMVGRGSRVTSDKNEFIILDFGDNFYRHSMWEYPREWTLQRPEKSEGVAPVKNCPECQRIVAASVMECPECGHIFKVEKKKVKEFAELELLPGYAVRSIAKKKGLEEKAKMTKAGLIKPVWVLHQLRSREQAKEFADLMGYKKGWLWYAEKNFKNLPWLRAKQETA